MSIGGDILRDKILNIFAGFFCLFVCFAYGNKHFLCVFSPHTSGKKQILIAGSKRASSWKAK